MFAAIRRDAVRPLAHTTRPTLRIGACAYEQGRLGSALRMWSTPTSGPRRRFITLLITVLLLGIT
ncbi:hypothetical protein, partial [Nonomuraea sp. NPDC050202]|uniref:hypothetical protein n=1 Tax=Nonomuraea sp. NPDC050202 TaxID=3155035 RepID=UPI0033D491DA